MTVTVCVQSTADVRCKAQRALTMRSLRAKTARKRPAKAAHMHTCPCVAPSAASAGVPKHDPPAEVEKMQHAAAVEIA